jgi:O-antigen ligase
MRLVRIGLCLLLAFGVLAFGAVETWSMSLLEIGAALLLVAWAFIVSRDSGAKIEWSPLDAPLLGFLAIGLLQLLLHRTAYPFLTRQELLRLGAYFIVFFLTAQAFRSRADLWALTWFLVVLCFAVSLLAIIQHFTSNGKIYWFQDVVSGADVFGPFVNRNHFAGFVELTLPVGLALLVFRGVRRDLFPLVALLTIVPMSALVLSGSRAGIISFVFGMAVLALLVRRRQELRGPRMAAVVLVALVALALIAWVGVSGVVERFSPQDSVGISLSRRASMFRGAAHIFLDHPVMGSGLGTTVSVYPRYETKYDGRVVDHVHDDYIETHAETGLLGGLCGFAFLWRLYRHARKNLQAEQSHLSRALHAGAIAALSALLLHSFADFNLHIPSNALLFLVMAYLATSAPLPSEFAAQRRQQPAREHVSVVR